MGKSIVWPPGSSPSSPRRRDIRRSECRLTICNERTEGKSQRRQRRRRPRVGAYIGGAFRACQHPGSKKPGAISAAAIIARGRAVPEATFAPKRGSELGCVQLVRRVDLFQAWAGQGRTIGFVRGHGRMRAVLPSRGDGTDREGADPPGSAGRGMAPRTVDLGNEPPLTIGEKTDEAPVRRAVSVRWLTGTILTGFTSIFLMGGALMAALNNPNQFAVAARRRRRGVGGDRRSPASQFGQKGDRMRPIEEAVVEPADPPGLAPSPARASATSSSSGPSPRSPPRLGAPKPEIAGKIPRLRRAHASSPTARRPTPPAGRRRRRAPARRPDLRRQCRRRGLRQGQRLPARRSDDRRRRRLRHRRGRADRARRRQFRRRAGEMAMDRRAPLCRPDALRRRRRRRSLLRARRTHRPGERLQHRQERRRRRRRSMASRRRSSPSPRARASGTLLEENDIADDDADEIVAALSDLIDLNKLHVGQKVRVAYAADGTEGGNARPDPRQRSTTTAPIRRRSRAPTTTASSAPTSRMPTLDDFADADSAPGDHRRPAAGLRRALRRPRSSSRCRRR